MRRRPRDPAAARLLATVASESRPYTDPAASYPRARAYQRIRAQVSTPGR
ncbi:hypothetical protein GCM10010166_54420 [Couchioplanes caeruleus subsp. azureus]|nr:hypothetical protein GCM10010166_54420 [Couchioplanes caeruleus subsp. azureus]